MAEQKRFVRYIGDCDTPPHGTRGYAFRTRGYYDRGGLEEGAWAFQPIGMEDGFYYVGDDDITDLWADEADDDLNAAFPEQAFIPR